MNGTLQASERKHTTKALYAGITRTHILDSSIGRLTLNRVRPSHVEGWVVELRRKGLTESTIRSAYTIHRAVLDTAVRDGALAVNPAAAIRRPRAATKEAPHLTPAQVAELIRAAEGSRYARLFALLVHTALRRGEALALQWSDVDLDKAHCGSAGRWRGSTGACWSPSQDGEVQALRAGLRARRATAPRLASQPG